MDEVTQQAGREVRVAFQVSMQVSRFLADVRRRRLERARQQSLNEEWRVRQTVEDQRRLAAPVLRRALDDRFWESAQPQDAAYVAGVADRFRDIDPMAAQAAQRSRREAERRWNINLDSPAGPIWPSQVDDTTLASVAPVVPGEDGRDINRDLADSARHAEENTPAPRETDPGRRRAMVAEGEIAERWAGRHYPGLFERYVESARPQLAYELFSAMAAEGVNMASPPPVLPLDGAATQDAGAVSSAKRAFVDATGIDVADYEARMNSDGTEKMIRAWEVEQAGAWPNPGDYRWHVVQQGSEAVQEIGETRLVAPSAPGVYTAYALEAAAEEAERAAMPPEVYLDHLQLRQRRDLILGHSVRGDLFYRERMRNVAGYRIAYARKSAAERPEITRAGQRYRQELASAEALRVEALHAESRASEVEARARADRAEADRQRAEAEEVDNSVAPGNTVGPLVAAGAVGGVASASLWDSPEARAAWVQGLLDQGHDPQVVRSALAGDRVLHEPARMITAPFTAPSSEVHQPPLPNVQTPIQTPTERL